MWRRRVRRVMAGALLLTAVDNAAPIAVGAQTAAEPVVCARVEFEAVVDGAGDTLRVLTQKNTPGFQAKLRQLRAKRGWTPEQFFAEGTRFVKDGKIAGFDEKAGTLLNKINSGSDEGTSGGDTGDCRRLAEMKADMAALVATQTEKWVYMFGMIDAELAK